jgi:TolB-like protein/DNA-binding winged helix-turn-helix (wHTH) protein
MPSQPEPEKASSLTPTALRFGVFELNLNTGELKKGGQRIKLQPQPSKVLAILAGRAGEIVTRDEIQQQVWGDELFVDFERGLNVCIQQIRGSLNDDADHPRFIETLPKRGYRFLPPVERVTQPSISAQPVDFRGADTVPIVSKGTRPSLRAPTSRSRKRVAAIVFATFAVALVVLYFARASTNLLSRRGSRAIHSIAVLPFDNFSGDPEQQYFADGMTEALTADLGQIRGLRVPSRTSVMYYKRANKQLREIARELDVDALVEGSVTRFGNHVGVTVQLLDGSRDQHLWGSSYERDSRDVVTLQHELARSITEELKISLTPEEQQLLKSSHPVNPDAYSSYLHGRYYWYKRTNEGFQKSIQYYEQAIVADPGYAPAYAGLADAYALLASSPNDALPPNEAMPKAKAAAQKALQLDDGLAEAHASLAYVSMVYEWNWAKAEKEFRRAIEINPHYAGAHEWYAQLLAARGREEEALSEVKKARDADPMLVLMHAAVAEVLYYSRHYDDVIAQCRQTLEMDPGYPLAHLHLGRAYTAKGMYSEAITEYRKAQDSLGETPAIVTAIGYTNAKAGDRSPARKALELLKTQSNQRYVPALYFAAIYTGLGDSKEGIAWLETAYQEHYDYLVYLNVDPMADSLRSSPRFQALLQKLGFMQ